MYMRSARSALEPSLVAPLDPGAALGRRPSSQVSMKSPLGPVAPGSATSAAGADAGVAATSLPAASSRATPLPSTPSPAAISPAVASATGDQLIAGWFREHVERVWRIVARLGVAPHSVEDIVQEAFITASRRRSDITPGFEGRFLVATAVRLCANYRRRAHVRCEVGREPLDDGDASPLPDAEQLLIAKRSRELLDRLLLSLPEPQREVFVLYELEGLSVPEIASLLELPLGTVSSRVWRARARFSELASALQQRVQQEGQP